MAETLHLARTLPFPCPRTRLLGRQAELAAARAALLDESAPLLSLIGPGGVGKTRLALEIAGLVESAFTGGAVWVDLAPVAEHAHVPVAFATALGLPLVAGQSGVKSLVHHLRRQQTLLLVDNCEHLIAPVAQVVAALLAACPALQVLATSRAPLRLRGEHEFAVEPLPLPPTSGAELEHLAQNDAVALFVERARAVRPAFALSEENAPVVAALCRRLDGLPLAIELAAARGRMLSPEALLAQMTDRLRLLSGGHRDLPARQQTIEATIAWSYALLDPEARRLFQRLAAFAGGCDLEGAVAVAGGDALGVLEGLSALRDQGLLRADERTPAGNRYTMLETVREYALERLDESGAGEETRDAHAAHFLDLVERAEDQFRGAGITAWLNRFDDEYANLQGAFAWLRERGKGELVWRLAGSLLPYWQLRGRFREGRQALEEALALPGPSGTAAWAKARLALGYFLTQVGDYARARALLEEALAVYQELGAWRSVAMTLSELMAVELNERDLNRARQRGEEALAIFRALDDVHGIFDALWIKGVVSTKEKDFARAHAEFDESLRLANQLGPEFPSYLLRARGWLAHAEGDVQRAASLWEERLAEARERGFEPGTASMLDDLGWLAIWQRDWDQANARFAEELALGAKLGDDWHVAHGLIGLAVTCVETGQSGRATWLFGAAEAVGLADGLDDDCYNPIQEHYDRAVASARRALDAVTFAEAWQAGRAMPRQQAIIRAFSDAAGSVTAQAGAADVVAAYERLTRREAEVLRLVARRQTDSEIADALYISRRTASSHVARILGKLGVRNRREAGAVAARLGLI